MLSYHVDATSWLACAVKHFSIPAGWVGRQEGRQEGGWGGMGVEEVDPLGTRSRRHTRGHFARVYLDRVHSSKSSPVVRSRRLCGLESNRPSVFIKEGYWFVFTGLLKKLIQVPCVSFAPSFRKRGRCCALHCYLWRFLSMPTQSKVYTGLSRQLLCYPPF